MATGPLSASAARDGFEPSRVIVDPEPVAMSEAMSPATPRTPGTATVVPDCCPIHEAVVHEAGPDRLACAPFGNVTVAVAV